MPYPVISRPANRAADSITRLSKNSPLSAGGEKGEGDAELFFTPTLTLLRHRGRDILCQEFQVPLARIQRWNFGKYMTSTIRG